MLSVTVLISLVATVPTAAPAAELPTELWQVAPDSGRKPWAPPAKPGGKSRAVVLVPGLWVHPLRPARAMLPELRAWQAPKSELVKALAGDSDVFAFAYAQTVPVDEVVRYPGLRDAVARLRKAGYKEVVLVGHSAGGIIARQFAEAHPDAGVTKVICVGAPFEGAGAAKLRVGYPKIQAGFVKSLAPAARAALAKANAHPPTDGVEFACVVCKLKRLESDGVVTVQSQWPEDLRHAGVPAVLARVGHVEAMQSAESVRVIAELAREKLTRWSPEEVEKARRILFGEPQK